MEPKSTVIEKVSAYKTPKQSPGYLLWKVSTAWRSKIESVLKGIGLTHPQFVVLAAIDWLTKSDKKIAQIDISKFTGLDVNTTSQVLRGLEAKNLIRRIRSVNERSKNPCLTELGSQVLEQALPAVENVDKLFFDALNLEERAQLQSHFLKLL